MKTFIGKAKFTKETVSGKAVRVNESFIIEAEYFGNAETRLLEYLESLKYKGATVTALTLAKTSKVIVGESNDGKWYDCGVTHEYKNEKGKTKKNTYKGFFFADSMQSASELALKHMGFSDEYKATSVKETDIVDFIPFK